MPVAVPCIRAGLVDGQLRCDVELVATVAELCPSGGPRTTEPIAAGDALDTVRLCSQRTVQRGDEAAGWGRMPAQHLAALAQPVDLNRASAPELASLPRVGPVLAQRIVEGRPYANVDALMRVRGIGPVTLQRVRSRVFVATTNP